MIVFVYVLFIVMAIHLSLW